MKSSREDTRPGFYWYPKDWMTDSGLRVSSLAAKGLWMEILNLMFFSPVRGTLRHANNTNITTLDLTNLLYKTDTKIIEDLMTELEANKVFDRLEDGTIINRKMYREAELSRIRSEAVSKRWNTKSIQKNNTKAIQVPRVRAAKAKESVSLEVDKSKYLDFVYLSLEEVKKLGDRFGKGNADGYVERLNGYIGQIGEAAAKKKYVSHYHTILNWARKDEKEGKGGTNKAGGIQAANGKYATAIKNRAGEVAEGEV